MENQNRHVYLMVYGAAIAAIYVALTMSDVYKRQIPMCVFRRSG